MTVLFRANQTGRVLECSLVPQPVTSDEGRVRDLGLRHLDWHNSTALANSALHIMGSNTIRPKPPRSSLIRTISWLIEYLFTILCSLVVLFLNVRTFLTVRGIFFVPDSEKSSKLRKIAKHCPEYISWVVFEFETLSVIRIRVYDCSYNLSF